MQEESKRRRIQNETKLSHIQSWKQSGLSMTAYCNDAGISISSLSKWVRSNSKAKEKFKPISLPPLAPVNQNNLIEILVNQQIKIRLFNNNDPLMISRIVRGLTS